MKRKICIVITTRGNYAKMRSVMEHLSERNDTQVQLIVAGGAILPKYGDLTRVIDTERFPIERQIYFLVEGENPITMAKSAGLAMVEFSTAFEHLQPDVVIVIADRFECLSIAMAATYMNIPIAHVEGGEVSGSIDESIRHAITKLAHLHFPATEEAAERIIRLGEARESVFAVGATSIDIIRRVDLSDLEPVMQLQNHGAGSGVGQVVDLNDPYLVVIQHPVTTEYDENTEHINQTISAIRSIAMPTIWIWPNMDAGSDAISKGIRRFRETENPGYVH